MLSVIRPKKDLKDHAVLQDLVDQMEQEENTYNVEVFYESYNTWRQEDRL